MKTSPDNGISVLTFVLGQGPRAIPIAFAPMYWPTLCTRAEAQATCDAIQAFNNGKGGPDGVQVNVAVMDWSGQGENSLIAIPDSSPIRNFVVAGTFAKGGQEFTVNEYGALVPDRLQTGFVAPKSTDVFKYSITEGSGLTFTWGPAGTGA